MYRTIGRIFSRNRAASWLDHAAKRSLAISAYDLHLLFIDPKRPMAYSSQNVCQWEVNFVVLREEPPVSWREATTPPSVWNDPEWVCDHCAALSRAG